MDKFIDEEKNMLENDPEIRDPSLRRKPSFFEKLLWNGRRKSTTLTALVITVPTAIVCALSACAPQADEEQQKAYASYVAAFEKYQTAVNEYNKLEVTDKPALPQSLVITNDLDAKATAEQLNSKNETLTNATAEINGLIESLKNKQAQQAAYQNYLLAWNDYESAANAYESLENPDKPDLSDNLVFSKTLNENSSTQELNQETANLQNATAEINKLIKQYEQETQTPPEPEKPMTKEEIAEKVTSAVETAVKNVLGRNATDILYLAIDYKEENQKYFIDILTEYDTVVSGIEGKARRLVRIPMQTEMTEESLKKNTFQPTGPRNGQTLLDLSITSQDSRAEEALKKLKDDNQVSYSSLTNITNISILNSTIDAILGCGATFVTINRIDGEKVISYRLNVKSDGNTKDMIGENLINGTLGTTYRVVEKFEYEFSENVILLGEIFNSEQAQEYENVDAEINGVRYAIIRNYHTVYNEALDKAMKEPESY